MLLLLSFVSGRCCFVLLGWKMRSLVLLWMRSARLCGVLVEPLDLLFRCRLGVCIERRRFRYRRWQVVVCMDRFFLDGI